MKPKNNLILAIGLVIFSLGLAASLIFNMLILWANLEGQSFWGYPEALAFDSNLTTEAKLNRLLCPMVLTPGEIGKIELKIHNPNNHPIEAWISAHISKPDEIENMIRELHSVPLASGDSATLIWKVDANNIINRRMIQMRVFLRLSEHHPPARTKHCGVIVVDLWGLSGLSITLLALIGGLVFQIGGIWLWWYGRRELVKKNHLVHNVLIALSILSVVMSFSSMAHSWVISLVGFLLSLIILFAVIGYSLGITEHASN